MSAEDQCGACFKWVSGEDRFFDNSFSSHLCKEHYYLWLEKLQQLRTEFTDNSRGKYDYYGEEISR